MLDELARALTVAARRAHNKRSGRYRFHAGAVAVLARARFGTQLTARAAALRARVHHVQVHVLVDASRRLRERQIHHDLLRAAEPKLALAEVIESALLLATKARLAEDLAEQLFRIDGRPELPVLGETLRSTSAARAGVSVAIHLLRRLAVGVVLASLRVVAEHLVRFGHFLEFFARIRIVLVRVRMELFGQCIVRFLDVFGGAVFGHTQDFVVVALRRTLRGRCVKSAALPECCRFVERCNCSIEIMKHVEVRSTPHS